jgi:SAM-dependent methyltransferase
LLTSSEFYDDVPIEVWEKILDSTMSYHWSSSDGSFENPVLALIPYIGNAKKILDVGCGFGSVAKILLDNIEGLEITGITNSQVQYDYLTQNPINNFNVILQDFNEWEPEEEYDLILFFESFTHFDDDVIDVFKMNSDRILVRDYTWDWRHFSDEWQMHFRTKSDFENLFLENGFLFTGISEEDNNCWEPPFTFWFNNIESKLTEAEKEIYQISLIRNLYEAASIEGHAGARIYVFEAVKNNNG